MIRDQSLSFAMTNMHSPSDNSAQSSPIFRSSTTFGVSHLSAPLYSTTRILSSGRTQIKSG